MGRLLLVRHGQARADDLDNYDRLSALGHEQARRAGAWLAAHGPVHRVVVGPLRRHHETWDAMRSQGVFPTAEPEDDLDEHDGLLMFAHNRPLLEAAHPDLAARVAAGAPRDVFQLFRVAMAWWAEGRISTPGPEQWRDFRQRVGGVIDRLTGSAAPDTTTVAITSGGVVSAAAGALLDLHDSRVLMLNLATFNTSMSEIAWGPGYRGLVRFNGTPHLPDDHLTHV